MCTMKKIQTAFLLLMSLLSFSSCIYDDQEKCGCRNQNKLRNDMLVSVSAEEHDSVEDVTLFIFDENKKYIRNQSVSIDSIINLQDFDQRQLYVVAWGNLKTDKFHIPIIEPGMLSDDVVLKLKDDLYNDKKYHTTPSDLFYGSSMIDLQFRNCTSNLHRLIMKRFVASLQVVLENVEALGVNPSSISFEIKGIPHEVSFNGTLGKETSIHHFGSRIDGVNVVSERINTFPIDSGLVLNLYSNGTLIRTATVDMDGNQFNLVGGVFSVIRLRFIKNTDEDSDVNIQITQLPWNSSYIDQVIP